MSDMSSLSHEYASTTDFSHHVNRAVLLLKKRYLGESRGSLDSDQLAEASSLIIGMVRQLLARLGAASSEHESPDSGLSIPEDVLIRLEEKQSGNLDYFRDDLAGLEKSLASGSVLGNTELALLDSICEVADASASATLRKLWRR